MQWLSDFNIDNTPTESWAILKLQNLKLEIRELEQLPILNVFVPTLRKFPFPLLPLLRGKLRIPAKKSVNQNKHFEVIYNDGSNNRTSCSK